MQIQSLHAESRTRKISNAQLLFADCHEYDNHHAVQPTFYSKAILRLLNYRRAH